MKKLTLILGLTLCFNLVFPLNLMPAYTPANGANGEDKPDNGKLPTEGVLPVLKPLFLKSRTLSGDSTATYGFIGERVEFAGSGTPEGILVADGSAVSRTTYAELYAAIGTTYGSGNGSTTFNLPDWRGRVVIGAGQGTGLSNRNLGETGGQEKITDVPEHTHGVIMNTANTPTTQAPAGKYLATDAVGPVYGVNKDTTLAADAVELSNTGISGGVDVMNPYSVINVGIRYAKASAGTISSGNEIWTLTGSDVSLMTGNVGIGIANPADKLHLQGGYLRMGMDGGASFKFVPHSSENSFGVYDANSSAYRLWINPQGNLGIGTTNPQSLLQVEKDHGTQGNPMVNLNNTGDGDVLYVKNNSTRFDMFIADFQNSAGSVMAVRANGNVGIGTNAPNYKLDVNGTYNAGGIRVHSDGIDQNLFLGTGNVTGNTHLFNSNISATGEVIGNIQNSGNGNARMNVLVNGSSGGDAYSRYGVMNASAWTVGIDNDDDDKFKIGNNSNPSQSSGNLMTLTRNGHVGVGTTSPGHLLDVAGTANATEYLVGGAALGETLAGNGLAWNATTGKLDATNSPSINQPLAVSYDAGLNSDPTSSALVFNDIQNGDDAKFYLDQDFFRFQTTGAATYSFDNTLMIESGTLKLNGLIGTDNRLTAVDQNGYLQASTPLASLDSAIAERGSQIAGDGLAWNATTGKLDLGSSDSLTINAGNLMYFPESKLINMKFEDAVTSSGSYNFSIGVTPDDLSSEYTPVMTFRADAQSQSMSGRYIFKGNSDSTDVMIGWGEVLTDQHGTSSQWYQGFQERGSQIAGNGLAWNPSTNKLEVNLSGGMIAGGILHDMSGAIVDIKNDLNLPKSKYSLGPNYGEFTSSAVPVIQFESDNTQTTIGPNVVSPTGGGQLYYDGDIQIVNSSSWLVGPNLVNMGIRLGTGGRNTDLIINGAGDVGIDKNLVIGFNEPDFIQAPSLNTYADNKLAVFGTSYLSDSVGIGTGTPGHLLDVAGTANATEYLVGGAALGETLAGNGLAWNATTGKLDVNNSGDFTLGTDHLQFLSSNGGYNRIYSNGGTGVGQWTFKSRFDDIILDAGENDSNPRKILFNIGGIERAQFDYSGRFGIGTTTPSHLLEMTSTNNPTLAIGKANTDTGGKATLKFQAGDGTSGNGAAIQYTKIGSDDYLALTDGSTLERFVMRNGGYFGMGTTEPDAILTLKGKQSGDVTTKSLQVLNGNDVETFVVGDNGGITVPNGYVSHRLGFMTIANAGGGNTRLKSDGGQFVSRSSFTMDSGTQLGASPTYIGDMVFRHQRDTYGFTFQDDNTTDLLTIKGDGNVGIGNRLPDHKLDVAGAVNATEYLVNGQPLELGPWNNDGGNVALENGVMSIGTTTNEHTKLQIFQHTDTEGPYGTTGIYTYAQANHTTGTFNSMTAATLLSLNGDAGTLTKSTGMTLTAGNESSATGHINNAYGLRVKVQDGAGTIDNGYGLYIKRVDATNAFGVYQDGASAKNYFAGNVSVGSIPTASLSSERFSVIDTTGSAAMFIESAAGAESIYSFRESDGTLGASMVWSGNSDQLVFETGVDGSDIVFSPFNGQVGIGHFNPNHKLDVAGAVNATEYLLNGESLQSGLWAPSGNDIAFTSGNVGIGTDTPSAALEINYTNAQPPSQSAGLIVKNNATGNLGQAEIKLVPAVATNDWSISANDEKNLFRLYSQNSVRMAIDGENGFMGIGTASPSATLEVAGTSKFGGNMAVDGKIESTRVRVSATPGNWPDYVFKKNYFLRPLSEVEAFIQANGHLPNIPKAEVVEKEGQDVGEIQTKLLEKVEELTLYLIEQQKQIEALKSELKNLKKD